MIAGSVASQEVESHRRGERISGDAAEEDGHEERSVGIQVNLIDLKLIDYRLAGRRTTADAPIDKDEGISDDMDDLSLSELRLQLELNEQVEFSISFSFIFNFLNLI